MSQLIPEFQPFKGQIPEFIMKLYHILEKNEYKDYLCWHGDDEILIKSGKKLQDKVLPHFFRHKHITSFIRQLNMYKFSKVPKLTKERNYMYFKNDHFKRGEVEQLLHIKRNHKKKGSRVDNEASLNTPSKSERFRNDLQEDQISIENAMSDINTELFNYKDDVKISMRNMKEILESIMKKHPETVSQLKSAEKICNDLLESERVSHEDRQEENCFSRFQEVNVFEEDYVKQENNDNMLTTVKNIPKLESCFFGSQLSFHKFD